MLTVEGNQVVGAAEIVGKYKVRYRCMDNAAPFPDLDRCVLCAQECLGISMLRNLYTVSLVLDA